MMSFTAIRFQLFSIDDARERKRNANVWNEREFICDLKEVESMNKQIDTEEKWIVNSRWNVIVNYIEYAFDELIIESSISNGIFSLHFFFIFFQLFRISENTLHLRTIETVKCTPTVVKLSWTCNKLCRCLTASTENSVPVSLFILIVNRFIRHDERDQSHRMHSSSMRRKEKRVVTHRAIEVN